jgi:GT2 family glycosyltransferase
MQVSVIIVSYNTVGLLRDCLHSLYEKTVGVAFEVIVVDNASKDATREMLAHEFPCVRTILNADNKGFGAANNQGVSVATGKYVFLLNSDTLMVNDAITILHDFFESDETGSLSCIGGSLYNPDSTDQISYGRFPHIIGLVYGYTFAKIFGMRRNSRFSMSGIVTGNVPMEVDYVTGADMMVPRLLMLSAGGFDEDFFLYFEETELCSRFRKKGYRNMIVPAAKIIHLCGMSTPSASRQELFQKSKYLFLKKHHGAAYARIYSFVESIFGCFSWIMPKKFN